MRIFVFPIVVICFILWHEVHAHDSTVGTRAQVIQLQRTTCFGKCPSYVITVFEDGDFVWEGREHVSRHGIYTGHGEAGVFERARALLEQAEIKEFKNKYIQGDADGCKENWTDSQSIRILIQTREYAKSVLHNVGCRGFEREQDLRALEDALDQVFGTKQWIGENH